MKITFWKSFGMGVADIELPPAVLASLKREFADEMHALKYVVFNASSKQITPTSTEELDEILEIADTARKYSLNHIEFSTACRNFCTRSIKVTEAAMHQSATKKQAKGAHAIDLLPMPKPGLVFFRRDSRRRGSCSVVSLEDSFTWVRWHHNKKKTRVATNNLRSRRFYSVKKISF
jgi:hypothetical protein